MFRKTMVATAIIGAGLGSMSGAAFAGDAPTSSDSGSSSTGHHGGHHGRHQSSPSTQSAGDNSCSNSVEAKNSNGSGRSLGDTTGGDQNITGRNLCHILSGNQILSNNNLATTGGTITNGDTTTRNSSSTSTITRTIDSVIGL